jgi:hypothetical protein
MLNYQRVLPAAPGVDQVLEVIVANENANVDQLRDALPEKRAAPWPNVGFRELVGWVWDGFTIKIQAKIVWLNLENQLNTPERLDGFWRNWDSWYLSYKGFLGSHTLPTAQTVSWPLPV